MKTRTILITLALLLCLRSVPVRAQASPMPTPTTPNLHIPLSHLKDYNTTGWPYGSDIIEQTFNAAMEVIDAAGGGGGGGFTAGGDLSGSSTSQQVDQATPPSGTFTVNGAQIVNNLSGNNSGFDLEIGYDSASEQSSIALNTKLPLGSLPWTLTATTGNGGTEFGIFPPDGSDNLTMYDADAGGYAQFGSAYGARPSVNIGVDDEAPCSSATDGVNAWATDAYTNNIGDTYIGGIGSSEAEVTCFGNLPGGPQYIVTRSPTVSNSTQQTIAIGAGALFSGAGSFGNVAIGVNSQSSLTTGGENQSLGDDTLDSLATGFYNIALGVSSGSNFTGSESNNIDIGNAGTVGESGVTRIGTLGTQTVAYIAGKDDLFAISDLPACTPTNDGQTEVAVDTLNAGACVVGSGVTNGGSTYCHVICNGNITTWVHF